MLGKDWYEASRTRGRGLFCNTGKKVGTSVAKRGHNISSVFAQCSQAQEEVINPQEDGTHI